MLGGKRNVLVRVPLRVDDCRRACLLVSDYVGGVCQARKIELFEDHRAFPSLADCYFGWGTMRRYGRGAFQPPGYFCLASSSDTAGTMMTSSPCFQFTGVATLWAAVSCMESRTRKTSSKLRPVLIG